MIFWFEKHNKLSWIITILIVGIIFYISSLSFEITPTGGFKWQTIIYHFYAFFFLTIFLLISLIKGKLKNKNLIFIGIILAIFYGISDEIHQIFVPGRVCAISDVLIDSIGIFLAGYLYLSVLLGKEKNITTLTEK